MRKKNAPNEGANTIKTLKKFISFLIITSMLLSDTAFAMNNGDDPSDEKKGSLSRLKSDKHKSNNHTGENGTSSKPHSSIVRGSFPFIKSLNRVSTPADGLLNDDAVLNGHLNGSGSVLPNSHGISKEARVNTKEKEKISLPKSKRARKKQHLQEELKQTEIQKHQLILKYQEYKEAEDRLQKDLEQAQIVLPPYKCSRNSLVIS